MTLTTVTAGTITWGGFWLPNLISWIGGGIVTAGIGAGVGIVVRRWVLQILGQQQATSEDTLTASRTAADRAGTTADTVTAVKNQMQDVKYTLSDLGERFTDVYGALIEERLQEARMRRVEDQQKQILQFMADLETERHTTGNLADFQRSARSSHE